MTSRRKQLRNMSDQPPYLSDVPRDGSAPDMSELDAATRPMRRMHSPNRPVMPSDSGPAQMDQTPVLVGDQHMLAKLTGTATTAGHAQVISTSEDLHARHVVFGVARAPARKKSSVTVVVARSLFTMVLLVNLFGIGGAWALRANQVVHTTLADLRRHLTNIETLATSANGLQPATLPSLQTEVMAAETDLRTLDSLIPLSGQLDVGGLGAYHRVLRLGIDALTSVQEGLALTRVLLPPLQGFVYSVTHPQASVDVHGYHLLTLRDVQEAQRHMALARQAWDDALLDRKAISPADVAAVHNPQVTALIPKLDALAPSVTTGFDLASALLDWSPRLFGLTGPIHFLLFNMDSDELRATGGFLGNYADLTVSGGALTSGVHLHDIFTLDCPSTNNSSGCPLRPVPSEYAWFTLPGGRFGVRDSNLNPDFPTAAGLAAHLYQVEGKPPVDGVIALTPDVVEGILRSLGSVQVMPFGVAVTADNLRNLLHFYHQNPQIGQQLGISASALGTTANKVFDVLAGQAIFAKLATMTPQQQATLGKTLLGFVKTKDIQVFVSNTRVEGILKRLAIAGTVANSDGDSEFVVDTNDGASYANSDVQETISDTVTLDASGGATHTLAVTHTYAQSQHSYVQSNEYDDLARVIVPMTATHLKVSGQCTPVPVTQAFHLAIGCQLSLSRGATSMIVFSWYVPAPPHTQSSANYRLLVQRQAGAKDTVRVRIVPPAGATLGPGSGPGTVIGGDLEWSATPLSTDTVLTAAIQR